MYTHPGPKLTRGKNKLIKKPRRDPDDPMSDLEWYWFKKAQYKPEYIWWYEARVPCMSQITDSFFFYSFSELFGDVHYKYLFHLNFKDPLLPPPPSPPPFPRPHSLRR